MPSPGIWRARSATIASSIQFGRMTRIVARSDRRCLRRRYAAAEWIARMTLRVTPAPPSASVLAPVIAHRRGERRRAPAAGDVDLADEVQLGHASVLDHRQVGVGPNDLREEPVGVVRELHAGVDGLQADLVRRRADGVAAGLGRSPGAGRVPDADTSARVHRSEPNILMPPRSALKRASASRIGRSASPQTSTS